MTENTAISKLTSELYELVAGDLVNWADGNCLWVEDRKWNR